MRTVLAMSPGAAVLCGVAIEKTPFSRKMGLIRFPQVVQGLWKHRLSSLPVQQFLKCQGDGAKVIHNDKEEANGQPQTPQRRGLHNDHAQQNENRHVAEEFCVVDGEGHIAPCVHDADAVAGEVADQRCNAAPMMPQMRMRKMFSTMFTMAATRLVHREWVVCWVAVYTLLRNWLKHMIAPPAPEPVCTGMRWRTPDRCWSRLECWREPAGKQ